MNHFTLWRVFTKSGLIDHGVSPQLIEAARDDKIGKATL